MVTVATMLMVPMPLLSFKTELVRLARELQVDLPHLLLVFLVALVRCLVGTVAGRRGWLTLPSPSYVLRGRAVDFAEVAARGSRKEKKGDSHSRTRRRSRSDSSDGSDEEQVFREASTNSVIPLIEWARRHPGDLFWRGLREQSQFTSARAGHAGDEASEQRVATYLNQVLLAQHPVAKIGVGKLRGLVTLQMAMDSLLEGNLGLVGDILMQRFKALDGVPERRRVGTFSPHGNFLATWS